MRLSRLACLLAATVLVVACGDGDADDQAADDLDGLEDELPEDLDDLLEPELDEVELDEDGKFRGQGVVVPIPDGWEVDPAGLESGVVIAGPPEGEGLPALAAAAGIERNPFLGFEGLGYEPTLEALRGLDPEGEAVVDEPVDLAGAERAHLLVFEALASPEVEGQESLPDTDQLVVLAEDSAEQVTIFNYTAETGSYDEEIQELILAEAGLDPDSEPAIPELPEGDQPGEPEAPES